MVRVDLHAQPQGMERAGVQVFWFRPLRLLHLVRASHRTHRKVLICDGRVGFTGGVGIAEEWEGEAQDPRSWRETHFRVRGPAVAGLEAAFLGNWFEGNASHGEPEIERRFERDVGAASVQVVRGQGGAGWSDVETSFRTILQTAQERVRITSPYFVPDDACLALLCEAAERGVQIEVLVPGPHIDSRAAKLGAADSFGRLLRAGVRIARFQPTMIHAKVITADGTLACIGSANFNHRSMSKDDEVVLHVLDPHLVDELDAHFDEDRARSNEIDLEDWSDRGFLARCLEVCVRPIRGEM